MTRSKKKSMPTSAQAARREGVVRGVWPGAEGQGTAQGPRWAHLS